MRRVGDEPALLLRTLLEAVEHGVQGLRKVPQLVARDRYRDALVQPVGPDDLGVRGHPFEWAQGPPGNPVADQRGGHQRDGTADQKQDQECAYVLLDAFETQGHHQETGAVPVQGGDLYPVALPFRAEPKGDHLRLGRAGGSERLDIHDGLACSADHRGAEPPARPRSAPGRRRRRRAAPTVPCLRSLRPHRAASVPPGSGSSLWSAIASAMATDAPIVS